LVSCQVFEFFNTYFIILIQDPNIKAHKDLTPLHSLVKFSSRLKFSNDNNNSELLTSTPSSTPRLSGMRRNNVSNAIAFYFPFLKKVYF
jgi:hypothetical protein